MIAKHTFFVGRLSKKIDASQTLRWSQGTVLRRSVRQLHNPLVGESLGRSSPSSSSRRLCSDESDSDLDGQDCDGRYRTSSQAGRADHSHVGRSRCVRATKSSRPNRPAALCLKHEYRNLIDSEDSRLVAEHTWDAGPLLVNMHQNNELELDFHPVALSTVYHLPCHLRSHRSGSAGTHLMKLIPALHVLEADAGCSGMAGTYGLKGENYRTSLRIGWPLNQQDAIDTGSIRNHRMFVVQTSDGARSRQTDPASIVLLAYAYGKMPEAKHWITAAMTAWSFCNPRAGVRVSDASG